MFKQMAKMLDAGSALVMTVSKEADGKLCVQVRPVGEFKNTELGKGITFTDDAETIDAEFGQVMESYQRAHRTLKEQVDDRIRVMEAAAEAEKAAKADAIRKVAVKAGGKKGSQDASPTAVPRPKTAADAADGEEGESGDVSRAPDQGDSGAELTLF